MARLTRTTSSSSAPRRPRSGRSERSSPSRIRSVVVPALLLLALAATSARAQVQYPIHTFWGPPSGDVLGRAVLLTPDMNGDGKGDVVLASPGDDTVAVNAGAVRVYAGGTWTLLHAFYGASALDQFGKVLASGDINLDGLADLIVGTPLANPNGTDSGNVSVFSGSDGSLLYSLNGLVPYGRFGTSLAAADGDGDGRDDILVGETGTLSSPGRIFVFSGLTGAVIRTIATPAPGAIDGFGVAVASADLDLDGYADIIVGAPGYSPNACPACGHALAYSGATGMLMYEWIGPYSGALGYSVAAVGDTDGDGHCDLVIGAPGSYGATFVYSGATGALLHALPSRGTLQGYLGGVGWGETVAGAGDVDGDGCADFLVCHKGDQYPAGLCCPGTVTVFSGRTGHPISVFHGFGPGDYFGISASGGVDIAGGSEPEIVVGAPQGTVVGGVGYAVIFDPILGPPAAWSQIAGTGCGSGLASPSLRVATPALGLSRPIVVSDAAPFSLGILFLSAPPASISHLPGSCSLALDPATVTPFLAFTTSSSGFWSTTFALPPDPTWAGTRLALQAALYPSLSPLGADLTNGVHIQLGW